MVRGALVLPHGTGQTVRVLVFARGDKEREAREAGADFAGSDDMVAKISEGFMDFDRVIATPDMMGAVGKLGRVLGPRGLMPNPKVGTVTFDVGNAVREAKGGKIEYRVEKAGIVHARIGKSSFTEQALSDNARGPHQRLGSRQAVDGQGHLSPEHHRQLDDGPGRQGRHRPVHGQDRGGLMERAAKDEAIGVIKSKFDKMTSAVLVDYKGMTVESATKLRENFRKAGVEYKVVKNTLVKHALKGSKYDDVLSHALVGMTAVAWSYEDPSAAAKVVKAFRKDGGPEGEKLQIKAGLIEGTVLTPKAVEDQLATMPGKDELRSSLLATLQAPLQQFVALLQAPTQNLVYVLAATARAAKLAAKSTG